MKLTSLFSGSSGNCLLVEHNNTTLLIDAGLPGNRIQAMLAVADVDPGTLDGILVTHEHSDHISGIGVLSRRYQLPIYANQKTFSAMQGKIGKIRDEAIHIFDSSRSFIIKDLEILPFRTPHDAAESVGFRINGGEESLSVATDIGTVTTEISDALQGCKLVFLEANHDIDMLMNGPYPFYLKERIRSDIGHLSNEEAGTFCCYLIDNGTEKIMLGHLSKQNNTPLAALQTVKKTTACNQMRCGEDYLLYVALRDQISDSMII
jgi:phosphoribosyl 1,2-cyclic phosphodiesterase